MNAIKSSLAAPSLFSTLYGPGRYVARCISAFLLVLALAQTGCNQKETTGSPIGGDGAGESVEGDGPLPKVVATTTIVADLVANIAGEAVELVRLMPPGRDPHQFTLTARDIFELRTADLIFYNGLNLEGKVETVYDELNEKGVKTVAVTDGISKDQIMMPEGVHPDPHVWGDPTLWMQCVSTVIEALKEIAPHSGDDFELKGNSYRFELKRLDNWIKAQVERVPWEDPSRRVLVTSHDAFGYWGRAYKFDVVSLQGISTVGEVTPSEVAKMVDFVKDTGVPVIFVETSTHKGPIQRVATDAKVKIGAALYSDSLGGDFNPTFNVRLQIIRSPRDLPDAGVGNIFLGQMSDRRIHLRVFNTKGKRIFDGGDKDCGDPERLARLKEQLKPSWEKGYVLGDGEASVIAQVQEIINYRPPAKNTTSGTDPGPETTLPLTGEDIDVRTYIGMMKFNAYKIASGLKAGIMPERLHEAAARSAKEGLAPEN